MATPLTYVDAPPRTRRPNTSLDVLPVIDGVPGPHLAVQFIPDPCAFPNPLPQDCWVTMGPAAGTLKTFGDAGDAVVSDNFGAYQGVECWLSGGMDTFSGVASRVLTAGEYRIVDGGLAALLAGAATNVTGAATVAAAIGLLEQQLADQVPAQGYIFLSPLAATYAAAARLVERELDGSLRTYLGTPVVVLTEPSMALTAYASGPVTIWRGPIISSEAPEPELNKGRALAERLFSIAIECGAWKVTMPAPTATGGGTGGGTPEPLALLLGSVPSSPIPDGTDVTLQVFANQPPQDEVYVKYSINGGPWQTTVELTQVTPTQFVYNVVGDTTTSGDTVALYAVSGATESNHIEIEVV